jgi:pimeloyl-ACP methyl ester carboxylesterase
VAEFGGLSTQADYDSVIRSLVTSLLRSPDYSPADAVRSLRGIGASQAALLPELATTDLVRTLPRLDVPLVMAQGRLDQVAPAEPAQRFFDSITAPDKQLVWFESSAHSPHLEEPGTFRDLLRDVRARSLARI